MTLIASVSGIRGTIGGNVSENLTPVDIVSFSAAYGCWLKSINSSNIVVVGRDARISGPLVQTLVQQTLIALGIDVIDVGLSTTPTVEMEVLRKEAQGGIVVTASHNPKNWNALKLLNNKGEFISASDGENLMKFANDKSFDFTNVDNIGNIKKSEDAIDAHIKAILGLKEVNVAAIKAANFSVVVDGVNSTGGIAVPALLSKLGVKTTELYCNPNGNFPHNPEPLKENLGDLSDKVISIKANLGIAVDPDVDRLVFVDEEGELFGEEYTLVACADYILQNSKGAVVSNLSSSRALADLANSHGVDYFASAVGEVNVVKKMKEKSAVIGGEGNGGVIFPKLHYGRDALVGIALYLSFLAEQKVNTSELKSRYSKYKMSKKKIPLSNDLSLDGMLEFIAKKFQTEKVTTIDGLKIDFEDSWVHLRKSNTEPIIRLYAEAKTNERINERIAIIENAINDFNALI